MKPFFSIVVPVYNVEPFLATCLNAIINQSFTDFEVIVVNDGSTDGCMEIIHEYCEKDSRITCLDQSNQGLFMARRNGLRLTTGRYILHIDSDDSCKSNMLEELHNIIVRHNPDLIIYNYETMDENDNYISDNKNAFTNESIVARDDIYKIMFSDVVINNIWTKCAKRELIDWDSDYTYYKGIMMGEDVVHSITLINNSEKTIYIDSKLYIYRINRNSMSRTIKESYVSDFLKVRTFVFNKVWNDISTDTQKLFINQYFSFLSSYLLKICSMCRNRKEYNKIYSSIYDYEVHKKMKSMIKYASLKSKLSYRAVSPLFYYVTRRVGKVKSR